MLFSGIAWTADGYVLHIVDQDGVPHVADRRFSGSDLAAIVTYLHTIQESTGQRLATVVDSTNGVVDGYLLAGGLDVYRADPAALGARPIFGSVSADALASLARRDLTAVTRLRLEDGSLLGRVAELEAEFALARPIMADLAPSGRRSPCPTVSVAHSPTPSAVRIAARRVGAVRKAAAACDS